jgi:hypothetical protein
MGNPALGNSCPRPPLGRDRRSCAAGNVQEPREMPKITDARIAILATNGFEPPCRPRPHGPSRSYLIP